MVRKMVIFIQNAYFIHKGGWISQIVIICEFFITFFLISVLEKTPPLHCNRGVFLYLYSSIIERRSLAILMSSSDELSICFAAATVPSFLKKVTNVEIRSSLRPCSIPCSFIP